MGDGMSVRLAAGCLLLLCATCRSAGHSQEEHIPAVPSTHDAPVDAAAGNSGVGNHSVQPHPLPQPAFPQGRLVLSCSLEEHGGQNNTYTIIQLPPDNTEEGCRVSRDILIVMMSGRLQCVPLPPVETNGDEDTISNTTQVMETTPHSPPKTDITTAAVSTGTTPLDSTFGCCYTPAPLTPPTTEPTVEVFKEVHHISVDDYPLTDFMDTDRRICSYDPCAHLHPPCTQIANECLCPGLSPAWVPPAVPDVEVGGVTASSALIRWCAPLSVVETYLLQVQPGDHAFNLSSAFRQTTVFGLRAAGRYEACLRANNGAGPSDPVCVWLETAGKDVVYVYSLTGVAVLLLLVTMLLSVCLYLQCKKPPARQTHRLSLISIPNPAFYNHGDRTASSSSVFKI